MVITAVHEAGHFYIAKLFKVKILDFSIGMGKSIKSWIGKDDTSYNIRLLPIGGYVKMLGEDILEENNSSDNASFASKKYYQKVLILFAGPFANFLLAILIFTILNLFGTTALSSKVGYILPDSQASIANFQEGDIIQKVDGKDVESRADVQMLLSRRLGDTGIINFSVNSEGINMEKMIPIQNWLINEEPKDLLADLGIGVPISSEIGDVIENSPASDAGLLPGDVIKLINSKKISSWGEIKDEITNSVGMPLEVSIIRNGEEISKSIIPRFSESGWIIGISSANRISEDALFFKSYALHSAFTNAVIKTYSTIRDSFT
ncbi:MAG: RIP metalloprotease RseP, partial [Pseudomonadota bacterium]|nr:RIP metalloprotease RseP [Pseudomonadota bacterium]